MFCIYIIIYLGVVPDVRPVIKPVETKKPPEKKKEDSIESLLASITSKPGIFLFPSLLFPVKKRMTEAFLFTDRFKIKPQLELKNNKCQVQ